MAILRNGLLGGITGKLGNTVCYMLYGKQVVRMIVKSDKPPTVRQLMNQCEMKIVNDFLKPIGDLIRIGFKGEAKARRLSAHNVAFGYLKRHAVKREGDQREMDYTKVLISRGSLPGLSSVALTLDGTLLRLDWSPTVAQHGRLDDRVLLLAYFPQTELRALASARYLLCGAERGKGYEVMELPAEWEAGAMQVYVFVAAREGDQVSNSQYLGNY